MDNIYLEILNQNILILECELNKINLKMKEGRIDLTVTKYGILSQLTILRKLKVEYLNI